MANNENQIYWDQRTYQNDLRIIMAVLHYALGNFDITRKWLEDLTVFGWIHIPNEALDLLGFASPNDFFNSIFNDNGETYQSKKKSIELNYESANDDHGYNPFDPRNDIGR